MNLRMVVNHAAARPPERFRQMLPVFRLHRHLPKDVVAALELAEKLVVEIVAVLCRPQKMRLHHAFTGNGDTNLHDV